MKLFEIEKFLYQVKDRVVVYKGSEQRVLRFSINEKTVKIVTDKDDITFLTEDFNPDDFPMAAEAVANLPSLPEPMPLGGILGSSGVDFIKLAKENIDQVKRNKEYIPQASAINEQLKTMVEFAKVQLEFAKLVTRK
jgi:hypothetical protein